MSSYRQIFKSSALFGGTQIINILIGIVRTKFLAVLLGPAGVGIAGMYQSTTGLIGTIAGFGTGRAGVRQIAEAHGTGDEVKLALTSKTLRWVSLASGLLGMLVVLVFCKPLSWMTFGNDEYVWGVATVSLVLLFNGISAGQIALLQGMRKLKDLAVCQIAGALFGSIASIAVIRFWGVRAVSWYLVAIAAFNILTSWWYVRKIQIDTSRASTHNMIIEASGLLKIGVAFMVSGLVSAGNIYLARVLVIRELGMDAVGLYSAVITLSSIYVNTVLQAMATDYYPRLTAVANDHFLVNRMVNEQTEMGLLLAIPGILGTLTLAPWVLELFYSSAFTSAANVIQWQLMGVGLCVVSWPLGIIMPAKGMSRFLIISEIVTAAVQIILLVVCMKLWGLEGAGISFLLTYLAHTVIVFFIAKKATGFYWSRKSQMIIGAACIIIVTVFSLIRLLPMFAGTVVGLSITAATSMRCFFVMKEMLGFKIFKSRKDGV
jgi:antigen flippase